MLICTYIEIYGLTCLLAWREMVTMMTYIKIYNMKELFIRLTKGKYTAPENIHTLPQIFFGFWPWAPNPPETLFVSFIHSLKNVGFKPPPPPTSLEFPMALHGYFLESPHRYFFKLVSICVTVQCFTSLYVTVCHCYSTMFCVTHWIFVSQNFNN